MLLLQGGGIAEPSMKRLRDGYTKNPINNTWAMEELGRSRRFVNEWIGAKDRPCKNYWFIDLLHGKRQQFPLDIDAAAGAPSCRACPSRSNMT